MGRHGTVRHPVGRTNETEPLVVLALVTVGTSMAIKKCAPRRLVNRMHNDDRTATRSRCIRWNGHRDGCRILHH